MLYSSAPFLTRRGVGDAPFPTHSIFPYFGEDCESLSLQAQVVIVARGKPRARSLNCFPGVRQPAFECLIHGLLSHAIQLRFNEIQLKEKPSYKGI